MKSPSLSVPEKPSKYVERIDWPWFAVFSPAIFGTILFLVLLVICVVRD